MWSAEGTTSTEAGEGGREQAQEGRAKPGCGNGVGSGPRLAPGGPGSTSHTRVTPAWDEGGQPSVPWNQPAAGSKPHPVRAHTGQRGRVWGASLPLWGEKAAGSRLQQRESGWAAGTALRRGPGSGGGTGGQRGQQLLPAPHPGPFARFEGSLGAFAYTWGLQNKTNERTEQRQTYECRGQTDGHRREGWGTVWLL